MKLPKVHGVSTDAHHVAEHVKEDVKERLERTDDKYKVAADKHRQVKCSTKRTLMVFLRKEIFSVGTYNNMNLANIVLRRFLRRSTTMFMMWICPTKWEFPTLLMSLTCMSSIVMIICILIINLGSSSSEVEKTDVEQLTKMIEEKCSSICVSLETTKFN